MDFKKLLLTAAMLTPLSAFALDLDGAKEEAKMLTMSSVATAEILAAINAQNEQHASLSQDGIIALDQKWRTEAKVGSGELIDKTLANAVSATLKAIKDASGGKYAEIFVMDNKGLNVGQSDVTSDYWQGDEAKFQETFPFGAEGLFMDTVELDESTGKYTVQVSVSVVDPETHVAVGVVTYGYVFE